MIHICGGLVHGPRRPRGGHHSEQPEIKMEMIAPQAAAVPQAKASALLRRASLALVATVWASGILFGAYLLLFFGGSALGGLNARWNDALQRSEERREGKECVRACSSRRSTNH